MQTRIFALALLALLGAGAVHAQQVNRMELGPLVERAWERAVAGRTLEARREESGALRALAAAPFPAAPVLGLAHETDRWTDQAGQRETEISVSAPVWLPGQRAAHVALADAQATQLDAASAMLKLELAGEVRDRLWALAALESELDLARQRAQAMSELEADVARRVQAGDLAPADLLLAREEALQARASLLEVERRRREEAGRMQLLTGTAALPASEEALQAALGAEQHPRVLAARAARERAERNLRLVAALRRDPPEVGLSYRQERAGAGAGTDHRVGIAVRIPFGGDPGNGPREAQARTELATAAAEERAALASVKTGIESAGAGLQQAEALTRISEERLSAARERSEMIQKAFELGEQGLPDLLRAQVALRESELAHARDRAGLGLARARLNQARGILP